MSDFLPLNRRRLFNDADSLNRVYEAAECRTQAELGDFFGIRQSSISDAKRRRAIPPEWLLTLLRRKGINPEWILTGQGEKYFVLPASGPFVPEDRKDPGAPDISGEPGPVSGDMQSSAPPAPIAKTAKECTTQELLTELVRRVLANLS